LNLDFWINPNSNPDVCRIAPKMLSIRYLVGISNFAECHKNRPVTVSEMLIYILFRNGQGSGKVIRNPYPLPVHHQKLISSSGRPNHNTIFQWNRPITFAVVMHTDRMMEWLIYKPTWSH